MNKEFIVQLTNKLYHLSSLLPKKEPLRFEIRAVAAVVLKNAVLLINSGYKKKDILISEMNNDLEILNSFFEVAKAQNWVSPAEILNLQQEYSKLKEDIGNLLTVQLPNQTLASILIAAPTKPSFAISTAQISARQEQILAILKERQALQVKDLKIVFPQVSKRTLRRDFESLLKKGKVIRVGEKNNTFYQIS